MTIKITVSEQVLLDAIAADATDMNANGVQVQPSTPYAAIVYPIENLAQLLVNNPTLAGQMSDGTKGYMAPLIRRIGPMFGSAQNLAPNFTIAATPTVILSTSIPGTLEVSRTIEVSFQGTAYCNAVARIDYSLFINGVQQGASFRYFFNEIFSHRTFSGSWIANLAVGNNEIQIRASNGFGTGNITLDGQDFINLTYKG